MGGCAGKNKSKRSNSSEPKSKPESQTKDDHVESKPENLPSSNGSTVKNDKHLSSNKEENGVGPDIQATIEQSNEINNAIGQIFASRVISVSDAEFEYELANLIYGHPENDYAETPLIPTTCKSTDV